MGLMDALYVGVSGLRTSQNALNTTSHNITNAETPGFVRQQTVMTDFGYNNIGGNKISTWQIGMGVDTQVVRQVRDQFLDKAFRRESGRQQFYEVQFEAAFEMQEVMGELEGVQFQKSIEDFWVALQELAKEPDSIVTRATLIQNGVNFIQHAENIYEQIQTYQIDLNTQIQTKVDRINEIGDKIRELNNKISFYECTGREHANDLRDERNLLLDELGGLIDITYKEEADGRVSICAEEVPFLLEDHVFYMDVKPISEDSEMLVPYWPAFGDAEVFSFDRSPNPVDDTDIGSLKGIILARGRKVGKFTDIPMKPLREDFEDDLSYEEAMKQFTVDARQYNKEINDSVIMATQSQFDQLIHGIVTTINDILCPNKEIMLENGQVIKVLDTEKASVGMDEDKTMGAEFFSRKSMARYQELQEVTLADGTKEMVYIYNEENPEDNYSLYTLGEIEINPEILKDRSKLPLSKNTNTGDFDIDVAEQLLTAWQEDFATLNPNELSYNNFNNYYTALIGELGTRGEKYQTLSETQESMMNSIDNERHEVMAVSTDEELTHLIKYQHAYNAAARYVNVVSEMLDHILSTLGA
ncbi:MAG: flagellar hook-associated protein FlgK [Lachnospiraceae bacterium]|nr:flagellar hook-associated protein FlgK [Lachnospiraceae bacterium]